MKEIRTLCNMHFSREPQVSSAAAGETWDLSPTHHFLPGPAATVSGVAYRSSAVEWL